MGVRLPAEYQKVEYLESTGAAQWIDVGFPITDSLSMELTFSAVTIENKYYMGMYKENNGDFYLYASSGFFQTAYGSAYKNTTRELDTEKHTFRFSLDSTQAIVTENGETIWSTNRYSPLRIDRNIRIAGSSFSNANRSRTYAFIAYDGANKIADFIPCYRKSNNKPGMYDLVTKQFFTNAGYSKFLVGPDVIDSISPWLFARRRLLMKKKTARLPAEYQEVEYLETSQTGAPYIDSGIAITEDLVFEIDFKLLDAAGTHYFMGAYNGYDFYLYLSGDSTSYFQTAFGSAWANTTLLADTQRHKFVYQFENENLVVRDSNTTILTKAKIGFSGRSILVAGTSEAQNTRIPCKTYESKMTKSGVVIQDLIPCYRKVDDTPGMYDLVSNTFFTNAGTGEFIVGADIN